MDVPLRAPRDARREALVERGTARRVVAAEAQRDDGDTIAVDIRARREIIEARAAHELVVVMQRYVAQANRLAHTRTVDEQNGEAPAREIGDAAQILKLLLRVEATEANDAR